MLYQIEQLHARIFYDTTGEWESFYVSDKLELVFIIHYRKPNDLNWIHSTNYNVAEGVHAKSLCQRLIFYGVKLCYQQV